MSAYAELVESVRLVSPYTTGSIHDPEMSQYTVCDASTHIMFFHKREAAEAACERMNTQAKLAEVLRTLETVTPEMAKAWANVLADVDGVNAWSGMLRASPLAPPAQS